jgi:hypothetical protein
VKTLVVAPDFPWLSSLAIMFLRRLKRFKDGKTHYYWSVVEPSGRDSQPQAAPKG